MRECRYFSLSSSVNHSNNVIVEYAPVHWEHIDSSELELGMRSTGMQQIQIIPLDL